MAHPRIIVSGAGPVGVVSALALAQHGYAVTLLEAEAVIDDNPRAATTHPSMPLYRSSGISAPSTRSE